jgi:hypothetical protein
MSLEGWNAEIGNDSRLPYPYPLAIHNNFPVSFNIKETNKLPRVARAITVKNYTR